jgi:hypothetical protein
VSTGGKNGKSRHDRRRKHAHDRREGEPQRPRRPGVEDLPDDGHGAQVGCDRRLRVHETVEYDELDPALIDQPLQPRDIPRNGAEAVALDPPVQARAQPPERYLHNVDPGCGQSLEGISRLVRKYSECGEAPLA